MGTRRSVLFIIALYAGACKELSAFGTGAPKRESVCAHRLPRHSDSGIPVVSQPDKPPYTIKLNTTTADHDDVIKLSIETTSSYFRGFVVQALTQTSPMQFKPSRTVGKFLTQNDANQLSCYQSDDTVTHMSSSKKTGITLYYRLPSADLHRPIIFKATVLQEFSRFWTNITSPVLTLRGTSLSASGTDPSSKWLNMVVSVATSLQKGKTFWEDNIRERMKLGFKNMINGNRLVRTRYIKDSLPFVLFENTTVTRGSAPDSIKSYRRLDAPPAESLSLSHAVTKLLKGDLKFSQKVSELVSKN